LPSQTDDLRRDALTRFLGAGITPAPSKALLVSALGAARRAVVALQAGAEPLHGWLASEVRYHGIRENAATLAAMEVADMRERVSAEYAQRHPDRVPLLRAMLSHLPTT
jgi:hypothetical protein